MLFTLNEAIFIMLTLVLTGYTIYSIFAGEGAKSYTLLVLLIAYWAVYNIAKLGEMRYVTLCNKRRNDDGNK